ncbi:hypothetical protein GEV33_014325 [Tenebrio molitor]|uniref:Uncharacterized protein n=1 Tax=Tenebrio molitor TaxID=7067 RepID=A0A8J6H5Y0_TENMO|nr:hypothetical protein GEV33_014325 [Tenebrio molitor]
MARFPSPSSGRAFGRFFDWCIPSGPGFSAIFNENNSTTCRMSWPILAPPITETNGQIRGIHIHRFRKEGRASNPPIRTHMVFFAEEKVFSSSRCTRCLTKYYIFGWLKAFLADSMPTYSVIYDCGAAGKVLEDVSIGGVRRGRFRVGGNEACPSKNRGAFGGDRWAEAVSAVAAEPAESAHVSVRRALGPMGGPADMPRARVTLEAEANSLYQPRRHRRLRRSLCTASQQHPPYHQHHSRFFTPAPYTPHGPIHLLAPLSRNSSPRNLQEPVRREKLPLDRSYDVSTVPDLVVLRIPIWNGSSSGRAKGATSLSGCRRLAPLQLKRRKGCSACARDSAFCCAGPPKPASDPSRVLRARQPSTPPPGPFSTELPSAITQTVQTKKTTASLNDGANGGGGVETKTSIGVCELLFDMSPSNGGHVCYDGVFWRVRLSQENPENEIIEIPPRDAAMRNRPPVVLSDSLFRALLSSSGSDFWPLCVIPFELRQL